MAKKFLANVIIALSMSSAPIAVLAEGSKVTKGSKANKAKRANQVKKANQAGKAATTPAPTKASSPKASSPKGQPPNAPAKISEASGGLDAKNETQVEIQSETKKLILDLRRADAQCKIQFIAKSGPLKILNLQEPWHIVESQQEVRVESLQAGKAALAPLNLTLTGSPREFALMGNKCQVQLKSWAAPGSMVLKEAVINLSGPLKDMSVYLISGQVVANQISGGLLVSSEQAELVAQESKGQLEFHSQSGSIKVSDHSGRFHLKQASGTSVLKNVEGELQLDVIKGNLVVNDPKGSVFIESADANVKVQLAANDAKLQVKNGKGRISVNLNGKSAWIDVLSQDGEISPPGSVGLRRMGTEKIAKGRTTGTSSKTSLLVRSKAGSVFVR